MKLWSKDEGEKDNPQLQTQGVKEQVSLRENGKQREILATVTNSVALYIY